eukprot:1211111-Alexandrium_andersonii.AAC.1
MPSPPGHKQKSVFAVPDGNKQDHPTPLPFEPGADAPNIDRHAPTTLRPPWRPISTGPWMVKVRPREQKHVAPKPELPWLLGSRLTPGQK